MCQVFLKIKVDLFSPAKGSIATTERQISVVYTICFSPTGHWFKCLSKQRLKKEKRDVFFLAKYFLRTVLHDKLLGALKINICFVKSSFKFRVELIFSSFFDAIHRKQFHLMSKVRALHEPMVIKIHSRR